VRTRELRAGSVCSNAFLRFVLVLAQYRSSHAELTTDRATNPSSALSDLESPHTPLAAKAILSRYSGRASSRAG
jgi:hypothetical protein